MLLVANCPVVHATALAHACVLLPKFMLSCNIGRESISCNCNPAPAYLGVGCPYVQAAPLITLPDLSSRSTISIADTVYIAYARQMANWMCTKPHLGMGTCCS